MTFTYDAAVAVRGVDVAFEVASGETVALLGENGSGKSTVLGVTAGLLKPDRGRVVLDDRVLTRRGGGDVHVPPHDRRVALLAQEPLLFPHLTCVRTSPSGRAAAAPGGRAAYEAADRWLAEVGAAELADAAARGSSREVRPSGWPSPGPWPRSPRLLLLDEPMAALDVAVTPALRQMLRRVLADRTVVLVTHHALDALLLADRVIVLEQGAVVEDGPTAQVLSQPRSAFAAQLAGLNMVTGAWRGGAVHTAGGRTLEGESLEPHPGEGDSVVAVFPPNAVSIFLERPGGSPRNVLEVTVTDLEPQSGHVRVRADNLLADVTPRAVAELDLVPGSRVLFAVKATEVSVYAT